MLEERRRFLVLSLPRWATDCLKRAEPALAASARPLVLWEKQKGAMRIVAVDAEAGEVGLFPGQALSDARALVPDLEAREIDRPYLERVFADFADWHSNASPIVEILTHQGQWGDLALDITGVSHLFSGEEQMLHTLTRRLMLLGYDAQGAIASSIGAAWALARYAPSRVLAENDEALALRNLPVAALRLEPAQVENLKSLGLKQIGQLYERDRRSLQARFGLSLLLRLDQALGSIAEKLNPRLPVADYYVERRFAEPIGLIDDVLMTAGDLAIRLSHGLEQAGLGAQAFHLYLYRVDHKVISLTVNAARATRDAGHIGRLFRNRADRLGGEYDAGFGIDLIRLAAGTLSPVAAVQVGAFGSDDGAQSLDHLYDRMTSRLGQLAVVRSQPVNTYIPERAVELEPVVVAAPVPSVKVPEIKAPRPLRLLPHPEPITVIAEVPDAPPGGMIWRRVSYRFVKSSGPERIAADWRQEGARLQPSEPTIVAIDHASAARFFSEGEKTRDYYVSEDDGGRRFWLFRLGLFGIAETPRWYLHGFFA